MVDETFAEIIRRRILTQWGGSLKTQARTGGGSLQRLGLSWRLQVVASDPHLELKFTLTWGLTVALEQWFKVARGRSSCTSKISKTMSSMSFKMRRGGFLTDRT
jgi:hypothetical protein